MLSNSYKKILFSSGVLLVSLIWFMVQFLRYVFPPLFDTFQTTYDISNTETGLLFTLLLLGYSSMQLPSGILSDRYDKKWVIVLGAGLFTVASFATMLAPTFEVLLVAGTLIGIGTGVHKTASITYLSIVHPEKTGSTLGIMDSVGQVGGVVAPITVILLLDLTGNWKSVFLLGFFIGFVLLALFVVYADAESQYREINTEENSSGPGMWDYVSPLFDRQILVFTALITMFTFVWNGIVSFLPLFLSIEKGFSTSIAGVAYSLLFVVSVVQAVTGIAGDSYGSLKVSTGLFILAGISLFSLILTQSWILIFVCVGLLGIGFHGFRPIRDAYLMELIATDVGGGVLGTVRTVMTVLGACSPVIIGAVIDRFGYLFSFVLLFGILVVACCLVAWMMIHKRSGR